MSREHDSVYLHVFQLLQKIIFFVMSLLCLAVLGLLFRKLSLELIGLVELFIIFFLSVLNVVSKKVDTYFKRLKINAYSFSFLVLVISLVGGLYNPYLFSILLVIYPISMLAVDLRSFFVLNWMIYFGLSINLFMLSTQLDGFQLSMIYGAFLLGSVLSYMIRKTIYRIIQDLENKAVTLVDQNNHIREIAYFDYLTGLPNKSSFLEHIDYCTKQGDDSFSIIMIEINRFRLINDVYGYETGDLVLKEIASRLHRFFGSETSIFRFGADEYVVHLTDYSGEEELLEIMENIKYILTKPYFFGNHTIHISVSIGSTLYPELANTTESLLSQVEFAVVNAKNKGLNQFYLFNAAMQEQLSYKMIAEHHLKNSIKNNELQLFYQPQVDAVTGRVKGFEALTRWTNKELGNIPPNYFIGLAEEIGFINELGLWVVENTCRFLKRMEEKGKSFHLSLNISASQIIDDQFIDQVIEIITSYQLPDGLLCLEITETGVITNYTHAIKNMHRLKSCNLLIALDDFGTGYSSLNYLKDLPVDIIKIDKSFINNIHTNDRDLEMLKSVLQITKNLKKISVAEGVEEIEQLTLLKELDCDMIQGYLFSRPLHSSHAFDYA